MIQVQIVGLTNTQEAIIRNTAKREGRSLTGYMRKLLLDEIDRILKQEEQEKDAVSES